MKKITLEEVAKSCNGEYIGNEEDKSKMLKSIVIDSRKVKEGALFIAIKGERVDGHEYISKAYDDGAICVISENRDKTQSLDKPYILVESTLEAIKEIAKYYREKFDIPFIGITGSVGKTSTKEMICAVLSEKYKVHKTEGNYNNEIGVPLTIFALEEDSQVAVIEMGISKFGEMTNLARIVKPRYCVITNIGECHLEDLKDKDGVLKAKTEMFKYKQEDGEVYLNGDDEKLREIKEVKNKKTILYGLNKENDYTVTEIKELGLNGIDCKMKSRNEEIDVHIPTIGKYMIGNVLCAYAIGKQFNLNKEEIKRGINNYKTVGSRAKVIKLENYTIIDDCYNANPVSVKSAIDMLSKFENRKVAIIGDMKELGKSEKELHKEVGKYIEEKNIAVVIGIGEIVKSLTSEIKENKTYCYKDVNEAKTEIKTIIKANDIILIKGSRSMKLERIVEYLKNIY